MERPLWAPADIDLDRPSIARLYDWFLGGYHNFEADRTVGEQITEVVPWGPMMVQVNRAYLRRAVQFFLQAGISQFLDLGSGIPTVGNVHEIVQQSDRDARIVYVDVDPVAVAHARALLEGNDNAVIIHADMREVKDVLTHPDTQRMLDLSRPIAILMVAVLHFVPDKDDPVGIIGDYCAGVAPGSYLALAHATEEGLSEQVLDMFRAVYEDAAAPLVLRTRAEIAALVRGLEPVEPGLTWIEDWRPEPGGHIGLDPAANFSYGGVWRTS